MLKKGVVTAAAQAASVLLTHNVSFELIAKFTEVICHFNLIIITGHCVAKHICGSLAESKENVPVLLVQNFLQQQ